MYIMIKSSQIRIIFVNLLLLSLTQISYSIPISRNRGWVFWYYSSNGQDRDCANYCILTFSIVGAIILLLILCGFLSCYRIKRQAIKDGRRTFFSQDSFLNFRKPSENEENEKDEKGEKGKNEK